MCVLHVNTSQFGPAVFQVLSGHHAGQARSRRRMVRASWEGPASLSIKRGQWFPPLGGARCLVALCHWSCIDHCLFTLPSNIFFFKGSFSFFLANGNLFIYYLWLCWVFVSVRGLSLVAASGGHSSSRCVGLSPLWPLLLRSTGSRCAGSVVVSHWPSCSTACGILPDQGSNPCPLHWQADSQPLHHQGSPLLLFFILF